MARTKLFGCVLACMLAAACGGDDDDGDDGDDVGDDSSDDGDGELVTEPECNPLGGARCVLPYPSSLYQIDDAQSPTGVRLDIPDGALPINNQGVPVDPALYNQMDGFSPSAPIITAFASGVDDSNLPSWVDFSQSLAPGSPTVLIDMETGELVPHFAELNAPAPSADQQALYIRPAVLLEGGRRYAVAIRNNLLAADGSPLEVPEGFLAIRDGWETDHERLERIRPRYDDIFLALIEHDIAPADLVVAWDFVTSSRESMRRDVLAGRDAALELLASTMEELAIDVTRDMPSEDPRFAREIEGFFEGPLLLTQGGEYAMETRLNRGANGLPVADGLYQIPFDAIVPNCALEAEAPVPLLVYGHGLLGDSDQVMSGGTRVAANGLCMVAIGTDMRGMSGLDLLNVAAVLGDINQGPVMYEALVQGVVNHISLVQVARARMATELFSDGEGGSIVDPDQVYYYGISQGGIFGGTIAAYDPVIERSVLQVGAMNYSMLLERSADWPAYRDFLVASYPNALDVSLILSLLQSQWDTTDPTSVADALLTPGVIPGVPEKRVLMQIGIADVEVSNVASEYQARSMGIPVLAPTVREPWAWSSRRGRCRTRSPSSTSA